MNRSPLFLCQLSSLPMSLFCAILNLFSNKDFVDWIFLTNFVRKIGCIQVLTLLITNVAHVTN